MFFVVVICVWGECKHRQALSLTLSVGVIMNSFHSINHCKEMFQEWSLEIPHIHYDTYIYAIKVMTLMNLLVVFFFQKKWACFYTVNINVLYCEVKWGVKLPLKAEQTSHDRLRSVWKLLHLLTATFVTPHSINKKELIKPTGFSNYLNGKCVVLTGLVLS